MNLKTAYPVGADWLRTPRLEALISYYGKQHSQPPLSERERYVLGPHGEYVPARPRVGMARRPPGGQRWNGHRIFVATVFDGRGKMRLWGVRLLVRGCGERSAQRAVVAFLSGGWFPPTAGARAAKRGRGDGG